MSVVSSHTSIHCLSLAFDVSGVQNVLHTPPSTNQKRERTNNGKRDNLFSAPSILACHLYFQDAVATLMLSGSLMKSEEGGKRRRSFLLPVLMRVGERDDAASILMTFPSILIPEMFETFGFPER